MTTDPDVRTAFSPEETFSVGQALGASLADGDAVLLTGGIGAGKTLLTKGILDTLGFDVAEVTSPSFTLVNLYRTATLDVYHLDLWRIDAGSDARFAVGLDEIAEQENALVIIEWAEHLGDFVFRGNAVRVLIEGDGDEARKISITKEHPHLMI